jgi:dTDP-4-amino-4,6-dideoxygalactose transaminase
MKLRAISRAWIDITLNEMLKMLSELVRLDRARSPRFVPEFENRFAAAIGTRGAVAFPSCRAAIYFSLRALDLFQGDEVILPAFTFGPDAAMVILAGLKPSFVDVDLETANIDVSQIEAKITPKTKVIFPTHLNGIPADMDSIRRIAQRHHLRILEDCARACGVRYKGRSVGSFDIGVFSFGYGKNFYIMGGGMAVSDDEAFLDRLRSLMLDFRPVSRSALLLKAVKAVTLKIANEPYAFRFSLFPLLYGLKVNKSQWLERLMRPRDPAYDSVPPGFKVYLSSLQAAQGVRFLRRIEEHNRRRSENSTLLEEGLSRISGLYHFRASPPANRIYFATGSRRKDELLEFLFRSKIDIEDESARDLTRASPFQVFRGEARYPSAQELDGKLIFLPNHPRLRQSDILYIIKKIKRFFELQQARSR